MSYANDLSSNNTDLQSILNTVKALPNPCNEEHAANLADELSTQDSLIAQIQEALTAKGYL